VITDKERKLGDCRGSDAVLVLTGSSANWGLEVIIFTTPTAPCEKSKSGAEPAAQFDSKRGNILIRKLAFKSKHPLMLRKFSSPSFEKQAPFDVTEICF